MNTALAFSGGKDSWACLWLNAHRLHEILVIWVNTGKNYPELLQTMALAKSMCPNFVEVLSDRDGQNQRQGIPAELVPIAWTRTGMMFSGKKPVLVQSYLDCHFENISLPLHNEILARGITTVIRGQRSQELHTSPVRHGDTVAGITYEQPIENWSRQQVLDYLARHMALPGHFKLAHTSMDCYDCTAFKAETKDRVAYTAKHHPPLHEAYMRRARSLDFAIGEASK